MTPVVPDGSFWPQMLALRNCVCEELKVSAPDEPLCFCGVTVGAPDTSGVVNGKGAAWVSLAQNYPYGQRFPQPNAEATTCGSPMAAMLNVGVVRCWPVSSSASGKNPPTQRQQEKAAELVYSDMAALQRAICACFSQGPSYERVQYVIQGWTPIEPQGALAGGFWSVFISER